jgi:flagellum-specific peptidoglycan hydrolase FlgJ
MKPQDFFKLYAPAAQRTCQGTGLCASVALAQAAIESGWGKSQLAAKYNNFGGIKAAWDWKGRVVVLPTREVIKGKSIVVQSAFRVYESPNDYFNKRVDFLRANKRYRRLFASDDFVAESYLFQECGYATDPNYGRILANTTGKYGLQMYDRMPGVEDEVLAQYLFKYTVKQIQSALNELGNHLQVDGIIGPRTLAAVNLINPNALLQELTSQAVAA